MPSYTTNGFGTKQYKFDYSVDYDFVPLNYQLKRVRAWIAAVEGSSISIEVSLYRGACYAAGRVFVWLYCHGHHLRPRFTGRIDNVSAFDKNPVPTERRMHIVVTQSLRQAMDYVEANPLDAGQLMYTSQRGINA